MAPKKNPKTKFKLKQIIMPFLVAPQLICVQRQIGSRVCAN
jgi:hypothetical protein